MLSNFPQLFDVNPFSSEYLAQEIAWYDMKPYQAGNVLCRYLPTTGRPVNDYLNWCFENPIVPIPVLTIAKRVWMSLTKMELQSMAVPIFLAEGVVATAGLGMGYFPLRVAEKPEVERVYVFENNPHVIKFFRSQFRSRTGFDKITIVQGDVYKNFIQKAVDFCFMDIYQTMLPDEVITDADYFINRNNISQYHYWGQERSLLELRLQQVPILLLPVEEEFFTCWRNSPGRHPITNTACTLQDIYLPYGDLVFHLRALSSAGRIDAHQLLRRLEVPKRRRTGSKPSYSV